MNDFKIKPPTSTQTPPVKETVGAQEGTKTFELSPDVPPETEVTLPVIEPSALIQQIREGQLDINQAVEILIDQALNTQPMAAQSETLRQNIRRALTELIEEDPTLAAMASAMKR